ncbi:MAG TPA: PIG-L family deacetylase [Firmicutes bacterium]|nr:PIG-L family deacetylase [Bacillota bacterium]
MLGGPIRFGVLILLTFISEVIRAEPVLPIAIERHRLVVVLTRRIFFIMLLLFVITNVVQAGEVVVWLLPHPDDGIIGMGDSIYQSVLTGNTNFFVYFTKGENSLARLRIVGLDGSRYTLSRKEFGEARCREVLAALGVLGVTCEQVTFLDHTDGALSAKAAADVIRHYAALYPGCIIRTVSPFDPHPDHRVLAEALSLVSSEPGVRVHPEYFRVYIQAENHNYGGVEKREILYPEIKAAALAEFEYFSPEEGRFGIAKRSTPRLISGAKMGKFEYVDVNFRHRPFVQGSCSTLDVGLFAPLSQGFDLAILYDFSAKAAAVELSLRVGRSSMLDADFGLGMYVRDYKTYLISRLTYHVFFAKAKYIPGQGVRCGVGRII